MFGMSVTNSLLAGPCKYVAWVKLRRHCKLLLKFIGTELVSLWLLAAGEKCVWLRKPTAYGANAAIYCEVKHIAELNISVQRNMTCETVTTQEVYHKLMKFQKNVVIMYF